MPGITLSAENTAINKADKTFKLQDWRDDQQLGALSTLTEEQNSISSHHLFDLDTADFSSPVLAGLYFHCRRSNCLRKQALLFVTADRGLQQSSSRSLNNY